jgi:hypothetical protein
MMILLRLNGVVQELPVENVVASVAMLWVGQEHAFAARFGPNLI